VIGGYCCQSEYLVVTVVRESDWLLLLSVLSWWLLLLACDWKLLLSERVIGGYWCQSE
jgi:hypothetical protein